MATRRQDDERTDRQAEAGTTMKRRGILAVGAAVVAGIVAKQTSEPVAASSALQIATAEAGGTLNGPVVGPTLIYDTNAGYTSSGPMLIVSCRNGPALAGVQGTTFGIVPGHTLGPLPPEKCGVYGDTDGFVGVLGGASQSGTGVKGRILSGSSSSDTVAVDGSNASTGVRGIGVRGECDASFGVGVQGISSSYYGMQGITDNGIAIVGDVRAGGAGTSNIGVLGRVGAIVPNAQANTVAVYGQNLATGAGGIGVAGASANGLGGSFQGGLAPIRLVPGALSARTLGASGHQAGEMYLTSDSRLFLFDGTNWREVLLGPPGAGSPPPPAARPSSASTTTQPVPPAPPPRP